MSSYSSLVEPLRLRVDNLAGLHPARAAVRSWLGHSLHDHQTDDVLLAVGEAVDNALEHGLPPIRLHLCWDGNRELIAEVHDEGPWMVAGARRDRGFGMPIMTSLMDAVSVDTTRGTTVILRRRFAD